MKSKQNYVKRSKLSPPLDKGDNVRVQLNSKTRTPASALEPHNDRSYLVKNTMALSIGEITDKSLSPGKIQQVILKPLTYQ